MHVLPGFRHILLRSLLAAFVLTVAMAQPVYAQDPGWLGELPSAEQVLSRFASDGDPVQSLGRQCAALDMIERRFFRSSAILTRAVAAHPATAAVQRDYAQAFASLTEQYAALVGTMDDRKQRTWEEMCENRPRGWRAKPLDRAEVFAMLPASVEENYAAAFARSDALVAVTMRDQIAAERRAEEKRQFRWIAFWLMALGGIVLVFTARILYRIGKYNFENTTEGGVVQFKTFGSAIRHNLKGQVSALVFLVSALTTFAGLAMMVSSF